MKRVLLVVLPYTPDEELKTKHKLRSFVAHPYGVLSIATYLKKNTGCAVHVFDCNLKPDFESYLEAELTEFVPDVVGISMMFDCSYWAVKAVTKLVKKKCKDTVLVIGGAAATASYEAILAENPGIDAVCYGEGELPFRNLVETGGLMFPSWATKGGNVPQRSKIANLDEVIDIDYSFINPEEYPMQEAFSPFAQKKPVSRQFFVVTSRGCKFDCQFCVNSANPDKSMRYASVEKVIAHVRKLVNQYGMNVLTFYDDQILFNKKRAKELFRHLAQFNLRIECPNGLSVAFIDDELAGLMRKAGMDTVCLAIESGSPHVMNDIINKPLHVEQVQPVVNILRKYGFWVTGYFVIGMPGETDADRELTRQAILDWGLDWASISNACPTRGSGLYRLCIEKGYIPKDMKIDDLDMNKFIISTPWCSPEHLVKQSYLLNLSVNFVNNHRMKVGDYETAMQAFLDVLKRYPDHAFAYYYIARCATELFLRKVHGNKEWEHYSEYFGVN